MIALKEILKLSLLLTEPEEITAAVGEFRKVAEPLVRKSRNLGMLPLGTKSHRHVLSEGSPSFVVRAWDLVRVQRRPLNGEPPA